MDMRKTRDLRPHEANERIYGDHADSGLVDSIAEHGIYNPLLITHDNRIIAGHRRHEAALRLGLAEVPVVVFGSDDELDIEEALIESNRQRAKTNEQVGREYARLKDIFRERESKQGARNDLNGTSGKTLPEVKPTQRAADTLGVSRPTADRAAAVVQTIDSLREDGKTREADQLRTTLNKSVNGAYTAAKEAGFIAPAVKHEEAPPPKDSFSMAEWGGLSDEEKADALNRPGNTKFNWQEENSIEWALWSWNPVTGCKHNCPYCYARDIAERFYPQKFEPTFIPGRLAAPFNTKLPAEAATNIGHRNVFTCSMADLFGKWVPREWIEAVLQTIAAAPQWNFLFLTKFPIRLAEFDFPDNAWVGTTVDCQARVKNAEDAFRRVNARVKWLSCEPMLEPLQFSDLSMFSWIVIGGSSKSTQTPEWRPPRHWINALEDDARAAGCMIYEKTNLLERIREYPSAPTLGATLPAELRYLPSIETR
jgi:protein gp37/ParB-like chromosome segregation protein Spo0J